MLIWIDSFDDRTAPGGNDQVTGLRYDAHNIVGGVTGITGRTGNGVNMYNLAYFEKNVTAGSTFIIGFACKLHPAAGGNAKFLRIMDGSTDQCYLQCNTDGTVSVVNGDGTVLGTTTHVFSSSTFEYLELYLTISSSVGLFTLLSDGVTVLTASAQNTQNASTTANRIRLTWTINSDGSIDVDDYYIADTTGGQNNSFLGQVKIECLRPSGAGNSTDWTPSAGSNYQCVDDTTPNDATDYVGSSDVGDKDTYAIGNLSATAGTILGVQTTFRAQVDIAGVRTVNKVLRSGGADYDGAAVSLSASWADYSEMDELDPATSAAWTIANVNALEAGIKAAS